MSPILVRPVREQLEHDRVIRLLQAKYKRKFDAAINPGNEQTAGVDVGSSPWYPDLVLYSTDRARKLLGTVEVETAESVNNLEAMSQWGTFSRLRVPFHLYIPTSSIETTKRLCIDLQISVAEMWAYNSLGDQMRFVLVQRSADGKSQRPSAGKSRPAAAPKAATKPAPKAAAKVATKAVKKPATKGARRTVAGKAAGKAAGKVAGKAVGTAARKPAGKSRTPARKQAAARPASSSKNAAGSSRTQTRK